MTAMTSNSTYAPTGAERTVLMTSTFESDARAFAAEFPTPNALRAIALAEAGTLTWEQVAGVFRTALAQGLAEVA